MSSYGAPPRALEIELGDATNSRFTDSLVMSNLGYFQLKASPNVWQIQLAKGQSDDIYTIEGFTGEIILDGWSGEMRYLNVKKRFVFQANGLTPNKIREGKEHLSLFSSRDEEPNEESEGILSKIGKYGHHSIWDS